MLRLDGLHKRYGDVVALDDCSFSVAPGQLLGFLGPNGAGKTTAMRSIFSLVRPDNGSVTWRDEPITADVRNRFGYMPEQRGLYPKMRIGEQLEYFGRLHGMPRGAARESTDTLLNHLNLGDRKDSRLEELSHGNQQRIQLATALVHDPEVLVLDEPFSGLDPIGVAAMTDLLSERAAAGAAVVFSSHQLDLVEGLCEEVVIIDRGYIVLEGSVRDLRSRSHKRYLTVEVRNAGTDWANAVPAEVVAKAGDLVKLLVDDESELEPIMRLADAAGEVTEFSYQPPNLSEVFREAVGQ